MAVREYLDKKGFQTLARLLSFGRRKIWHGTRTEWDALGEDERAKYDQAEIEEEDGNNGNGVVYVADRIEKGNYNPVTSNAVAEALNQPLPSINGQPYSEEQWTGKTWLDGRKIYYRSLHYLIDNNSSENENHFTSVKLGDHESIGFDFIISINGVVRSANVNDTTTLGNNYTTPCTACVPVCSGFNSEDAAGTVKTESIAKGTSLEIDISNSKGTLTKPQYYGLQWHQSSLIGQGGSIFWNILMSHGDREELFGTVEYVRKEA